MPSLLPAYMAPWLSITTMFLHPALCRILNIPYPAEPAPDITTFTSDNFLSSNLRALKSAAG